MEEYRNLENKSIWSSYVTLWSTGVNYREPYSVGLEARFRLLGIFSYRRQIE